MASLVATPLRCAKRQRWPSHHRVARWLVYRQVSWRAWYRCRGSGGGGAGARKTRGGRSSSALVCGQLCAGTLLHQGMHGHRQAGRQADLKVVTMVLALRLG